jgi:hypothetical protein
MSSQPDDDGLDLRDVRPMFVLITIRHDEVEPATVLEKVEVEVSGLDLTEAAAYLSHACALVGAALIPDASRVIVDDELVYETSESDEKETDSDDED